MNPVDAYLKKRGWKTRPSGMDNYSLQDCPYCGDSKWHFNIHKELGLWRCMRGDCGAAGNLYTLKCKLGDIVPPKQFAPQGEVSTSVDMERVRSYNAALTPHSNTFEYLRTRGVSPEAIKHFQLGAVSFDNGVPWIAFPYLQGGECRDIKYRTIPPAKKSFRKEPNSPPCLFNQDALRGTDEAILVEGELDCISMWQVGYRNVVSLPLGAGTFKPEHWDALADKKKLYILTDNDEAGNKGASAVANRLDPSRCFRVILPGAKDINEYLCRGGTKEEVDYLLRTAKPMGIAHTVSILDALSALGRSIEETGGVVDGPSYPWANVTHLFGPMGYGEVTTVMGEAGVGKTSYCLQIVTHVARVHQVPAMLFCLEMPITRLAQLVVSQTTMCDRSNITNTNVVQAMTVNHNIPLYLAEGPAEITWDSVREILVGAIRRFGIRVWVMDNLQFLARSNDMVSEVGKYMQRLKLLAKETNTHCIIVSHLRKSSEGQVASQYAAAWSQAISADSDSMHSLFRKTIFPPDTKVREEDYESSNSTFEDRTLISCAKSRYAQGGRTTLWLNGSSGNFIQPEEVKPLS